jgi:hypothetical protein
VIRRISENFVPAAINLYQVRKATDGARELFQSVQRQKDQYQGIWIVAPDGKVLAGHHDFKSHKTWAQEVLETLDAGLKAFGTVEPRRPEARNPLPFRGTGVRAGGTVSLALYGRQMMGGGRHTMPAGIEPSRAWVWDGPYRPDGPSMIDTLDLSAEEWSAFAPPSTESGTEWTLPEAVARKFVRLLSASSDQSGMPRPEEAKVAELRASVEAVESGAARIRLAGRWEMARAVPGLPEGNRYRDQFGTATAKGVATYDAGRKELTSFLLVFDGTLRVGKPDSPPGRVGAVAEWRRSP